MKFTHVKYEYSRPLILKVGSKVIIRNDLKATNHGVGVNPLMVEYGNKKAVITDVRKSVHHRYIYRIDIDNGGWNWTEDMFKR